MDKPKPSGLRLVNPETPTAVFKSEQDYDAWKASLESRNAMANASALADFRGIPTKRFEGVESSPWAGGLIYGPAGVGKTWTAISRLLSTNGIFYEAAEFIEDARAHELDRQDDLQERRLRGALRTAHLVIDDLGARRPTQFAEDAILRLVNQRWKERLETLVTSNLSPAEIMETWGQRIASRIEGFGPVEKAAGKDRRKA